MDTEYDRYESTHLSLQNARAFDFELFPGKYLVTHGCHRNNSTRCWLFGGGSPKPTGVKSHVTIVADSEKPEAKRPTWASLNATAETCAVSSASAQLTSPAPCTFVSSKKKKEEIN